jgi:hypothetical protein
MIGTQFIKQQIDEGHLLLRVIPLSPQYRLIISDLQDLHPILHPKNVKLGVFIGSSDISSDAAFM